MLELKRLERFTLEDQRGFGMYGYRSPGRFLVTKEEDTETVNFFVKYVKLAQAYIKHWPIDPDDFERYDQIIPHGLSFGAYDDGKLAGVVITEPRPWNKTLWIWEMLVAESHRRLGVGTGLLDRLTVKAARNGFRALGLEVQNTNAPAIRFYQRNGFVLDGLDLSYYTNTDAIDGEVAFFMKKKLAPPPLPPQE